MQDQNPNNRAVKNAAKRLNIPAKDLSVRERRAYLNLFLEQNRGNKSYRFGRQAGALTGRIIRPLTKKHGSSTSELAAQWPQIVGPRYAKLSRPARINGGKNGNSLLIIARGPAATLISANADNILEKVNQFLGTQASPDRCITRLKITQGEIALDSQAVHVAKAGRSEKARPAKPAKRGLTPTEETKLHTGLETVKNDKLKLALEKLGRGVISRQPR